MVSLRKWFLLGAAFIGVANSIPLHASSDSPLSTRVALAEKDNYAIEAVARSVVDTDDSTRVVKRAGRMTLQWSPQGRIFFLLGASFPQSVIDGLYGLGEGGPAKALLDNFMDWLHRNNLVQTRAYLIIATASKGGVYGKAGGAIANDFGFALNTRQFPAANDLQDLLTLINRWASQAGSLVQVIARPNGFFDPAAIGAGENLKRTVAGRSRSNTCPADMDLLKYASNDVAIDIDINTDMRWAGECDEA